MEPCQESTLHARWLTTHSEGEFEDALYLRLAEEFPEAADLPGDEVAEGVADVHAGIEVALGADDAYGTNTGFSKVRGTAGRTPTIWALDLGAQYTFNIWKSKLALRADIFNVTNEQRTTEVRAPAAPAGDHALRRTLERTMRGIEHAGPVKRRVGARCPLGVQLVARRARECVLLIRADRPGGVVQVQLGMHGHQVVIAKAGPEAVLPLAAGVALTGSFTGTATDSCTPCRAGKTGS